MKAKQNVEGFDVKMATNGWVVGPLPDRTIFDKVLPKTWDAITSIDLNTGHSPVDPSYAKIMNHAKWVIPWMEVSFYWRFLFCLTNIVLKHLI